MRRFTDWSGSVFSAQSALVWCALALAGCGDSTGGSPSDAAVTTDTSADAAADAPADTAADVSVDAEAPRCSSTPPECQDQSIQGLGFFDTPNTAAITEESAEGGVFVSAIDATGGGMTPTRSYIYARFTPTGMARVNISDEQSLRSLDWDIAFRRFIVRLNSGVSGPSCVDGARTAPSTTFDALTAVPASLTFRTEQYFTPPTCDLVPDGSGLGSPSTALSSFWRYAGCVHMTGNVYVVRLRDGRSVKLQVLSYYNEAAQAQCDDSDTIPTPSGAGHMRVRWAFLP